MRQRPIAITSVLLLSALALAGCGGASSATDPVTKINVGSSAIVGNKLPARYTCDGQDISPPLEWGAVPANVKDLALFVVGFIPQRSKNTYHLSVEWAVAGLSPALHKLAAGQLPPGAYLGVTSNHRQRRYSICPKKGDLVHYQFELYGLPEALAVSRRFAGLPVLET